MSKFILTLVVSFAFAQTSLASTSLALLPKKQISMEVKNAGAKDIIKHLLEESGLRFELPASLTNSKKISIEAKRAAWIDIFNTAIASAGFQHSFDQRGVLKLTPILSN